MYHKETLCNLHCFLTLTFLLIWLSLFVNIQGMLNTVSEVIKDSKSLMSLWKHECCRVFADRFTTQEDKDWFEQTLKKVVHLSRTRHGLNITYIPKDCLSHVM